MSKPRTSNIKNPQSDKPYNKQLKIRQIVLDTETTGLSPEQGHRIIEIGAIELIDRRFTNNNFHQYLQPDREIDAGAIKVHGIVSSFLADKPRFADIAASLFSYLQGAELIIHNAPFDIAFLNAEFARLANQQGTPPILVNEICTITDTLVMARQTHTGQSNNLDALCKRYNIDQSQRTLHGALLDAKLLATVYLAMTGGQVSLSLDANTDTNTGNNRQITKFSPPRIKTNRPPLPVIRATTEEEALHQARLQQINQKSDGQCVWLRAVS